MDELKRVYESVTEAREKGITEVIQQNYKADSNTVKSVEAMYGYLLCR